MKGTITMKIAETAKPQAQEIKVRPKGEPTKANPWEGEALAPTIARDTWVKHVLPVLVAEHMRVIRIGLDTESYLADLPELAISATLKASAMGIITSHKLASSPMTSNVGNAALQALMATLPETQRAIVEAIFNNVPESETNVIETETEYTWSVIKKMAEAEIDRVARSIFKTIKSQLCIW